MDRRNCKQNVSESKGLFFTAKQFLHPGQKEKNSSMCLGIMAKNNDILCNK
jgi:hypothetical protein